jgi:hypothetical protein
MLTDILGQSAVAHVSVELPASSGIGLSLSGKGKRSNAHMLGGPHVDAQAAPVASFAPTSAPSHDGSTVISSKFIKAYVILGHSVRVLAQADSNRRMLVRHGQGVFVTDLATQRGSSAHGAQCELLASADSGGRVLVTGLVMLAHQSEMLQSRTLVDITVPGEGSVTLLRWHPTIPYLLFIARASDIYCVNLLTEGLSRDVFPSAAGDAATVKPAATPGWLEASPDGIPIDASSMSILKRNAAFITSFDVVLKPSSSADVYVVAYAEGCGIFGTSLVTDTRKNDIIIMSDKFTAAMPKPLTVRAFHAAGARNAVFAPAVGLVVADAGGTLTLTTIDEIADGGRDLAYLETGLSELPRLSQILSFGMNDGRDFGANAAALLAVCGRSTAALSLIGIVPEGSGFSWAQALHVGGAPGAFSSIALAFPYSASFTPGFSRSDSDSWQLAARLGSLEILTMTDSKVVLLSVPLADALPPATQSHALPQLLRAPESIAQETAQEAPALRASPPVLLSAHSGVPEAGVPRPASAAPASLPKPAPEAAIAPARKQPAPKQSPAPSPPPASAPQPSIDQQALSLVSAAFAEHAASLTGAIGAALDASLLPLPTLVQQGFAKSTKQSLEPVVNMAVAPMRAAALSAFSEAFEKVAVPAFERAAGAMINQISDALAKDRLAARAEMAAQSAAIHEEFRLQSQSVVSEMARSSEALKKESAAAVASLKAATAALQSAASAATAQSYRAEISDLSKQVASVVSMVEKLNSAAPPSSVLPAVRVPGGASAIVDSIFKTGVAEPPPIVRTPTPISTAPVPLSIPSIFSAVFPAPPRENAKQTEIANAISNEDYVQALKLCSSLETLSDTVFFIRALTSGSEANANLSGRPAVLTALRSLTAFERLALLQRFSFVTDPSSAQEFAPYAAGDAAEGDVYCRSHALAIVVSSMHQTSGIAGATVWNDKTIRDHVPKVVELVRKAVSGAAATFSFSPRISSKCREVTNAIKTVFGE